MDDQKETQTTSGNPSYSEYFAFTDTLLREALAEKRYLSVDLYHEQISHIKQLIYLAATVTTALAGVIVCTPYWNGKDALFVENDFCLALILFAALIGILSFLFGAYCLRGEGDGTIPAETVSFLDRASDAYKPDGENGCYDAKMKWINEIDLSLDKY